MTVKTRYKEDGDNSQGKAKAVNGTDVSAGGKKSAGAVILHGNFTGE